MKIKGIIALFISCIVFFGGINVSAETHSYTYNHWGEVVSAPYGYVATDSIDGVDLGIGAFKQPSDLFVAENGYIYISDTGNNRVVCFDSEYSVKWVWDTVYDGSTMVPLKTPKGLFVDSDDNIYICLTDSGLVVKCNPNGQVVVKYQSPESPLLNEGFVFEPSRVIVSKSGITYVLIDGFHLGALVYDSEGVFQTFFGSNDVKVTAKMVSDKLLRKLMTEEQKAKLSRYVPVQYDGFDIDENGFVYTCTKAVYSQEIRRLNTLSDNVLQYKGNMGDLQSTFIMGNVEDSEFTDLCVDKNGFISALDKNRGRIFQYDSEGNLMMIFGGSGDGLGLFKSAVSIDENADFIYVLDNELGNITKFRTTEYGKMLRKGIVLFQDGLYTESTSIWKQILKMDVNSELAYNGLGKSLHAEEKYAEAMECFKKANNREEYSESFKQYRSIKIKKYFPIVITTVLIFFVISFVVIRIKKKFTNKKRKKILSESTRSLLRVLSHPADECAEIKYKKTWSMPIATTVLFLFFAATVTKRQLTSFIFNNNNTKNFNIFVIFLITVGGFLLYTVINWAVTTLLVGKGKIKEIYCASCYALIPYVFTTFLSVVLSHFMILDEQSFLSLLQIFGLIWTAFILFSALKTIHEYSFAKVLSSLVLTALGMAFVVFIIMLFISLVEQLISFIKSIYNEIMYRR